MAATCEGCRANCCGPFRKLIERRGFLSLETIGILPENNPLKVVAVTRLHAASMIKKAQER